MTHFDEEIESTRKRLLSMAGRVEECIRNAIKSLKERDKSLARKVIEADTEIDREEVDIEEKCKVIRETAIKIHHWFIPANRGCNIYVKR